MKKLMVATMPTGVLILQKNNNAIRHFLFLSLLAFLPFLGYSKNEPVKVSDHPVAPVFEDITIYRLQVKFVTCNNYEAGTDDDVYIQMKESYCRIS